MKNLSKKGFTLLEMLIIMLIVVSFSYALYNMYSQTQKGFTDKINESILFEEQAYLHQKFMNDIDSSFLFTQKKPFHSRPLFTISEKKEYKSFKFLIEKNFSSTQKMHPLDIGLYDVEYRFEDNRVTRYLHPITFTPSPTDRTAYDYLQQEHLVIQHSPYSTVTGIHFSIKNKNMIQMVIDYNDNGKTHRYLHRCLAPLS